MADNSDLNAHVTTYSRMIGMFKMGTIAVVILTALIIWAIVE